MDFEKWFSEMRTLQQENYTLQNEMATLDDELQTLSGMFERDEMLSSTATKITDSLENIEKTKESLIKNKQEYDAKIFECKEALSRFEKTGIVVKANQNVSLKPGQGQFLSVKLAQNGEVELKGLQFEWRF